jgi:hypothetical protein
MSASVGKPDKHTTNKQVWLQNHMKLAKRNDASNTHNEEASEAPLH